MEASEKGWLAAFEMARFIGHHKGCTISNHRDFIHCIGNQRSETGDSEWTIMMSPATNLHYNFLEDWYDYCFVKMLLDSVQQLMNRLEVLLDAPA